MLFAPHETRPWNPLIARTFYLRAIIDEWGNGTPKMAELTGSVVLKVPEIDNVPRAITITFKFEFLRVA